jgi:septal ring-binding cell division protein DamX
VARVAVAAEAALHQTLRIMIPQVTRLMNLELVAADGTFPPSWSRVATEEGSEERSVPSRGAAAAAAADAMADAAAVVAADAASHHSVAADAASQHQQQTAAAEGSEEKELQVAPPQHRAEGLQLEGPTSGDRVRTVPQRLDASMLAVPQYGYHHGKPNPTPKPN